MITFNFFIVFFTFEEVALPYPMFRNAEHFIFSTQPSKYA